MICRGKVKTTPFFYVIMILVMFMKKILLVEDDIDIIHHLSLFLKNKGFKVDHTDSQKNAIHMILDNKYDLILLDISLKEGNGFSLYNEIKAYKNIPIVFLTASNDEFSIVTGLNLGADDYIEKPLRPRVLLSRIQNIMKRYQTHDTIYQYENIIIYTSNKRILIR